MRHLLTVDPSHTLRRACKVMNERAVGCAVVMENEKVAGIITERDILRSLATDSDPDSMTVSEVMTRGVISGAPGWELLDAVKVMTDGGFRHLLVMEMEEPVGIVSLRDLMESMAAMVQGDGSTG